MAATAYPQYARYPDGSYIPIRQPAARQGIYYPDYQRDAGPGFFDFNCSPSHPQGCGPLRKLQGDQPAYSAPMMPYGQGYPMGGQQGMYPMAGMHQAAYYGKQGEGFGSKMHEGMGHSGKMKILE